METKNNSTEDVFSKFINKAKKKLSKKETITEEEIKIEPKKKSADYSFVKSTKSAEAKKLEAKIKELLKDNPNAENPIELLIDHSVYDKLADELKTRYILQLSTNFNEIKNKLQNCK